MYEELIKTLRYCGENELCFECPKFHNCFSCGGDAKCYQKLLLQAADAIENLSEGFMTLFNRQRWISVKDKLPKPFESVLVHIPDANPFPTVREGYLTPDGDFATYLYGRGVSVTHWMPLPEPPKEENIHEM